jgi:hypothetical protein
MRFGAFGRSVAICLALEDIGTSTGYRMGTSIILVSLPMQEMATLMDKSYLRQL